MFKKTQIAAAVTACITLVAILCPCITAAAAGINENAALYYWEAAALMQQPVSVETIEILSYVEGDFRGHPPMILTARPAVSQWLMGDRAMVAALAKAGRCNRCEFFVRTPGDPFPTLEHLSTMQLLADRALAVAKAYEFGQNSEASAAIYRDLFKLIQNLDQDRTLRSGLVGVAILQRVLMELEGFLSRDPDREALLLLTEYFKEVDRPVFHLGEYLRAEARGFRQWMLKNPAQMERKLVRMYGPAAEKIAVARLMALDPQKKVLRMGNWIMEYESWMLRLANTCEEPYEKGVGLLRWSDKEKKRFEKEEGKKDGNPLLAMAVPTMSSAYERFLAAEGQFSMAAIMSYSARYLQDYGRWPVTLDELSISVGEPLPFDPFSGEDFIYKSSRLLPRMMMRIPRPLVDRGNILYRVNIKSRRKEDQLAFDYELKRLENEWRANARKAAEEATGVEK